MNSSLISGITKISGSRPHDRMVVFSRCSGFESDRFRFHRKTQGYLLQETAIALRNVIAFGGYELGVEFVKVEE